MVVRKRSWIVLGLAGFLLALGLLLVRPLARNAAVALAEREGLILRFAGLELGASSVTLHDVRLTPKLSGFMDASFERVRLGLSFSAPRLRSVWVEGGRVVLRGSIDEVREGYRTLRRARSQGRASSGAAQGRFVRVHDVKVVWQGALEAGVTQELSGVELERGPGGLRVGAGLVQFRVGHARLEMAGLVLGLAPNADRVDAMSVSEARVSYELAGPQPPDEGRKTEDEPATSSEPGLLTRFQLDPALPKKIAVALRALRKELIPRVPEKAGVERLWVTVLRGREHLAVGPGRLSALKKDGVLFLSFEPGKDSETPLAFQLEVPLEAGDISGSLAGGPITFHELGLDEGAFGLRGVHSTELSGKVDGTLGADAVELGGALTLRSLQVYEPKVAAEPLQFPELMIAGTGRMRLDGSQFLLKDGEFRFGEARLLSTVDFVRTEDSAQLSANVAVPAVACGTLVRAAPEGFLGLAGEIGTTGTFGLDLGVHVDTKKLADMRVSFRLENDCRIQKVPGPLAPEQFTRAFTRTVPGSEDLPMLVESGPGSAGWAAYDEISPYLETALLVTEDGRFFHHHGFDPRAIESSIRDNVVAGRFVRGASTISMQLAKNLYLSREKVLSRKIKEALLTMVLEQSFEKRKLLELYMNVVELGPGVYGVKQAASYYFNTTPDRLTIAQCFFLASVLPAPKKQHFESDGHISKSRRAYLERLMQIAFERERLSSTELTRALAEELVLGRPETGLAEHDPSAGSGGLPGKPPGSPALTPEGQP